MDMTPKEVELILCGGFLRREASASECPLSPADFSDAGCRAIFEMCRKLEAERQEVSLVSVCERLPALTDTAVEADGRTDIAFGRNFAQLAGTVARNAKRRALAGVGKKLLSGEKDGSDPEQLAGEAWDGIAKVLADGRKAETRNFCLVCDDVLTRRSRPDRKRAAVPSGIPKLDACLGSGFRPGNLIVLASRPSVGKSALLLSLVLSAAAAGSRVLFVSLEMTAEENAERYLAASSGFPVSWFANDLPLSPEQMIEIAEAQRGQNPALVEEYDSAVCRVADVRRLAQRMRTTGGLGLIAVDYLGLLQPENRSVGYTRNDEVAGISRALKELAMEFCIPVVAAHQLNRAGADSPRLEHLRDSGAVEQDADVVLLLSNPQDNVLDSATGEKRLLLTVAKNRQGMTGSIRLHLDAGRMRFLQESA